MRKFLLVTTILFLATSTFSQQFNLRSTVSPKENYILEEAPKCNKSNVAPVKPETRHELINGRYISYIPIGQSGNAYGFYGNPRTYLWADPNLNSVVFTHRMTGGVEVDGNSRISYDVSIDGGETWDTNVQVYDPDGPGYTDFPGRYPQGTIVNPPGNTEPQNAFYTYFIPVIDYTNGVWGGSAYGSNPLTETDPPSPTQVNLTSGGDYWRFIPDAYTATTTGKVYYVDGNYEGADYIYNGTLTLGEGEIINGELVINERLLDFLETGDAINDHKIAFSPDGLTGYIMILSDCSSNPIPFTSYHPILLKTTDGGITWSDPIHVQLGGVDGIESIKNYWYDYLWNIIPEPYEPPHPDSTWLNMGFHGDIIVDNQGNPHITGIIAYATEDGWYPQEHLMATWHLYSNDGGNTWDATALYDNIFFDGTIGGLNMYNRPYAMSTIEGDWLFFSWLDTDLDGAENNINPNIFVVGYNVEDDWYGDIDNVTELSLHWFSAYYGSGSQYVFEYESYRDWSEFEIPFVFTEYTVQDDPDSEMNFYYINDYYYSLPIGIDENSFSHAFKVEQNFPNPAIEQSSVLVTTKVQGTIDFTIHNVLGQLVYMESVNNKALGHTFEFDVRGFDAGIYFYSVKVGGQSVSKKMIVK